MPEISRYKTPRDPRNAHTLFLIALSLLALYLSAKILRLFVEPLVWSTAFAVLLSPLANRMRCRIPNKGILASILTLCLGLGILVPAMWAAHVLINTAITGVSAILPSTASQFERQYPQVREALQKIESSLHISTSLSQLLQSLGQQTRHLITISAWGAVSLLLTLFTFFYMIRDGERFLRRLEEFLPLSDHERNVLYSRFSDTIHATLFGSVVVSAVQGLLGAFLFWWLALPGAALWGLLMGLLALIPYLGAFVVWIPLAALFLVQGQWHDAIIITAWGMIVIGLSDNLLYPILVGKRLRYHSLLVFLFLVGGVWCFGSAGIIIGPTILAILDTTIDMWRGNSATTL
jgi:predicted PurR-regulated permease PerM